MMSIDELNELLPAVITSDADCMLLPTDTWLSYHSSIQGVNLVSNTQENPLPNPGSMAKQALHDYEVLKG
jgi:hypothetical protein